MLGNRRIRKEAAAPMPSRVADERHNDSLTREQLLETVAFYRVWETLINRISPQICRRIDLDNFLRATVAEIGRLMDLDRCNLMVYRENRVLKIDYEYRRDDSLPSALDLEIPIKRDFLATSGYRRDPFALDDVAGARVHPVLQQMCLDFGTRSLLVVPIHLGDEPLAFMGLHHSRDRHVWNANEINLMRSLANQLAVAYQYARMYLQMEREVQVSGLLLELGDALSRHRHLDEVIAFLLDRILELVTADRAGFGYFDLPGRTLRFVARRSVSGDETGGGRLFPEILEFSEDNRLLRELERGEPLVIADDSTFGHEAYRIKRLFGAAALLAAPLILNGALFGVLLFAWDRAASRRREEDIQVVESILRQLVLYFERNQLSSEILRLKRDLSLVRTGDRLLGNHPAFRQAVDKALELAAYDTPLLILGEPGTGRELLAESIHRSSARDQAPFVRVPCRLLDPEQFRRRVFGDSATAGALAAAAGGTVFFHEVDTLPADQRAELLELLAGVTPGAVRGRRSAAPDARMLFSAAALPPEAPDASMWRALHSVALPPLRERRGDIPLLVQHAVETIRKESGKYLTGVESDALHALTGLDWPGNVPQLRQAIETAAISATGPVITLPDLAAAMPHLIPGGGAGGTLHFHVGQSLDEIERTAILQTLETLGGDKQKTARVLGIGRKTLYRKLDRYRTDGALPENRSRHASRSRND